MREKLNENPIAQIALIGILALVGVVVFIGGAGGGGGEEEESAPTEATVAVAGTGATGTATGSSPGEAVENAIATAAETGEASAAPTSVPAPPPPAPVTAAYDAGKTVVLLVVDEDGIDDRLVTRSSALLAADPDVAAFVVPAKQIARYAAITVGLDVNRVPALVVMRPKRLSGGAPQASVNYGFQTPQSIVQAVRDASYKGPETTYHPN